MSGHLPHAHAFDTHTTKLLISTWRKNNCYFNRVRLHLCNMHSAAYFYGFNTMTKLSIPHNICTPFNYIWVHSCHFEFDKRAPTPHHNIHSMHNKKLLHSMKSDPSLEYLKTLHMHQPFFFVAALLILHKKREH